KVDHDSARTVLTDLVSESTPITRSLPYQIRDLALIALLADAKKKPSDYGFSEPFPILFKSAAPSGRVQLEFRGFTDDDTRDRAITKWKQEAAAKKPK